MKKTSYFLPSVFLQFLLMALLRLVPIIAPLPFASPLAAFNLAYARANVFWGFAFGFCNVLVVGMIRSLVLELEPLRPDGLLFIAFCYGLVMGSAGILIAQRGRTGYLRSVAQYAFVGFFAIVVFDFLTGVVVPCSASSTPFLQQCSLQLDWTLRHSMLNLIFVPIAPIVDRWITANSPDCSPIERMAYA